MVPPGRKLKVADLVKRGALTKIARKADLDLSHVSRVFSGDRPATAKIRRAASEVFRVPQRDLLFPMDAEQSREAA
jgi:transcriptional regulator with XRE-family HTH domain